MRDVPVQEGNNKTKVFQIWLGWAFKKLRITGYSREEFEINHALGRI
jgi:hypothetical protein